MRWTGWWGLADQQQPVSGEGGAIAVDGKVLRGARTRDGHQVHLFAALLQQVDLAGRVVGADALHTTPGEARWLVGRGAGDVLVVKGNQPGLVAAIDRVPPGAFSPGAHHR